MIQIGNDIVDLSTVNDSTQYISRLLRYAFDLSEQDLVKKDKLQVWKIWSMKEAAYKSAVKLGWENRFRPKDFVIKSISETSGTIAWPGGTLECICNVSSEYVHTISFRDRVEYHDHVIESEESGTEKSTRLKTEASKYLGNKLDAILEVEKDEKLIPHFFRNGEKLDIDLSLSHDGKFIAFVVGQ